MKKLTPGNHLTLYLLAICALLTGALSIQSRNIVHTQENSTPKSQTEINPLTRKNFTAPGVAAFGEIIERPLFIAGREPPPKPEPKPRAVVKLTPLQLLLVGVVLSPEEKVAILHDTRNSEVLHLTIGMQHQGWELVSMTDKGVTFKRGEQRQELTLEKETQ